MKPIIGIVEWPYSDKDSDLIYEVTNKVIEKVAKHGGLPIGIFPTQIDDFQNKRIFDIKQLTDEEIKDLYDAYRMCDAIIKPGALKIYGFERYAFDFAYKNDTPYLGICAGMQMMAGYNNEFNNVLNDDDRHHSKEKYAHSLKIIKNTLLYDILREDEIMVNSRHRYHIDNSGINDINAVSEDGLIEGIESDKTFQLGLQWHPENLDDVNTDKIFDALIDSAYTYKKRKR